MKKRSIALILFILICLGVAAFIYFPDILPTSLDISNIHAEKSKTTLDYTSGKHEESTKIIITYDINNPQDIKNGILTQWIGYDKSGKVIFNETKEESLFVDYTEGYYEFDEEESNLNNLDNVVKLELNIYKNIPQEPNELYGYMITSKSYGDLLFHGETDNITFTGKTRHNVDDTPKETSRKPRDPNRPIPSHYDSGEGTVWYWGYNEIGERMKIPYDPSVPKWGQ